MNHPFFSIVMPAYNAEHTIEKSIKSVQKQTYHDWELVIVDDKSKDLTIEVLKNIASKDARIRYFCLEHNTGSAFQPRKKAMFEAVGQYIVSLDSDDEFTPNYLAEIYHLIQQYNPEIVITQLKTDSGVILPSIPIENGRKGVCLIIETINGWRISMNGAALYKDFLINTLNRYDSSQNDVSADERLSRQLLLHAQSVCYCPEIYLYHDNPESITRKISLNQFKRLISLERLRNFISDSFGKESEEYEQIEIEIANEITKMMILYADFSSQLKPLHTQIASLISDAKKSISNAIVKKCNFKTKVAYRLPLKLFIFLKHMYNFHKVGKINPY